MEAKRLSLDIISKLPETIIETILCLLPIEEAARTSILSREWRYKWTKIPKLVFSEYTSLKYSTEENSFSDWDTLSELERARINKEMRCKLFYAIYQIPLLRQGPIHEFTLSISMDDDYFEIDQILLNLSRNHSVKKLTFDFSDESRLYGLPLSFFSLHHLTDLSLEYCNINHKPIFKGFGSLTSLSLKYTRISGESLLHLLSNSPSLKRLCMLISEENFLGHEKPSIMELVKCIPVIEHLTTWGSFTPKSLVQSSVPEELPASLIHLKYVCIDQLWFANVNELTFLAVLMKCSPNLEKIKLESIIYDDFDEESVNLKDYSDALEEYTDVWLEHLIELEIEYIKDIKLELEFVKLVLARSPNLKKVTLRTVIFDKDKELKMLKNLLRTPCVSPVEFIVKDLTS